MKTLTIIGAGMGTEKLLSVQAREAIQTARRIYSTPRLARELAPLNPAIVSASLSEICAALEPATEDAAVLVSGDAGFYSLSRTLCERFGGRYFIEVFSGQSSLQYLCARLCVPYDDVKTLSLHGRSGSLVAAVAYNKRVFVLTGGEADVPALLSQLCAHELADVTITVGEQLGSVHERITTDTAGTLRDGSFSAPAVLLIENPAAQNACRRLRDDDFIRGDVPMTKEEVRELSAARLQIQPQSTVYDIGAGTGSVSIALAQQACEGMVYAVEREPRAVELLYANRRKFGAYNIAVINANAPQGLDALPAPDTVFIGGSGGGLYEILQAIAEKGKTFTVCVNVIALESLHQTLQAFKKLGIENVETVCVNIARAKKLGSHSLMMGQNPVYILSGRYNP